MRNPGPFIEEPRVMIDEAYLVQGHTLKKGPDDSLVLFSLGYENETSLPNAGYHLYNCRSLTTDKRRSVGKVFPVFLEGLHEAGPEGKQLCSHNLSLNHSNMRLEVRRGRVPAPSSGHGRPQGARPPAPIPLDPRSPPDVQLRPEVSPL